ncbi:MAG: hypothetical protein K9L21_05490 [Spirochaetia bacterium]|nr:hypothetical protein [Spirochaetia bacterium]
MRLTYKPGDNPAFAKQIRVYAGAEEVENLFVTKAYRIQGKLTLEVEITDCEINRDTERALYADVSRKHESTEERADQHPDQAPEPRRTGAVDQRHPLPAKRKRDRDNGKN